MSMEMEAKIEALGVVPVVVLQDAKDAVPLAKALCQGGLPCAEVTFRTAAAAESIRKMTQEFPEMLVGAGTVLTVKQVDEVLAQALAGTLPVGAADGPCQFPEASRTTGHAINLRQ